MHGLGLGFEGPGIGLGSPGLGLEGPGLGFAGPGLVNIPVKFRLRPSQAKPFV